VTAVNCAVAFFGNTVVFPLDPFFLREKSVALRRYFTHRAICVFTGHDDMKDIVQAAALRRRVEPALLHAVIEVESRYGPHRISPAGAMGAAQLIAPTARMLGVDDPFDPNEGVDGGARYLREMLDRFKGDRALAVAAYNAGPGAVVGGRVPENGETEFYVKRVMAAYRANKAKEPPPAAPAVVQKPATPKPPEPVAKKVAPPEKKTATAAKRPLQKLHTGSAGD
jgi:hypothetical protein